ncbi:hypothetical protein D3Z45_21060 [Lachnospiraceae bacterium]|nr:hypothetical protein [Lachnospiraceae bacterium]
MIAGGKGLFGSPFSHVLSFHNSFLYISNFTDIFIIGLDNNKLESGEIRGNMLTQRFAFAPYRTNFVPWEEAGVFA